MNKGQKGKGGKHIAGASVVDIAIAKNAEGVSVFAKDPRLFTVFIVSEDVGVVKKSLRQEYVLKGVFEGYGSTMSVFVPSQFLTKNGKLALREMGIVGRRLAVSSMRSAVERVSWNSHHNGGGCMATGTVIENNHIVSALLP